MHDIVDEIDVRMDERATDAGGTGSVRSDTSSFSTAPAGKHVGLGGAPVERPCLGVEEFASMVWRVEATD